MGIRPWEHALMTVEQLDTAIDQCVAHVTPPTTLTEEG